MPNKPMPNKPMPNPPVIEIRLVADATMGSPPMCDRLYLPPGSFRAIGIGDPDAAGECTLLVWLSPRGRIGGIVTAQEALRLHQALVQPGPTAPDVNA